MGTQRLSRHTLATIRWRRGAPLPPGAAGAKATDSLSTANQTGVRKLIQQHVLQVTVGKMIIEGFRRLGRGICPCCDRGPVDGLHRLGLPVHHGLLFEAELAEIGYSEGLSAAVDSTYHR